MLKLEEGFQLRHWSWDSWGRSKASEHLWGRALWCRRPADQVAEHQPARIFCNTGAKHFSKQKLCLRRPQLERRDHQAVGEGVQPGRWDCIRGEVSCNQKCNFFQHEGYLRWQWGPWWWNLGQHRYRWDSLSSGRDWRLCYSGWFCPGRVLGKS